MITPTALCGHLTRADEPGIRSHNYRLIDPRLHDRGDLCRHRPHVHDPTLRRHVDVGAQWPFDV